MFITLYLLQLGFWVFVPAADRGTDPGRKLSVKSLSHLQIHVLCHSWMRFQLFQVGEGDLIYEGRGTEVLVREALPLGQGKVAFPFALTAG